MSEESPKKETEPVIVDTTYTITDNPYLNRVIASYQGNDPHELAGLIETTARREYFTFLEPSVCLNLAYKELDSRK